MKRLAALALAAIVLGCGKAPEGAPAGGKPPVPVRLAPVESRDLPRKLLLTGRTEADASVTLKARLDGQVAAMVVAEGRHVRQGDTLIQLDPADLQAKLDQAAANLAKSRAQAAKARADVERYIALREKGFVSEEKVGEMRTAAAAAAAVADADAAAHELARLQRGYATVRAPFDGVVGAQLVYPGTTVKANDTALLTLNRVRPLKVAFAVPEKYLPQLQAGLRGSRGGSLPAQIATPAGQPLEGKVSFLDNAVDTASGAIQLKAVLPNADEALTPGQFVNVALVLETLPGALVVPAEAVQQGSAGSFVFVAWEGKVALRRIALGPVQDGLAVIADGLKAGEIVVTEGQLRLIDGAAYRTADKAPPKEDTQPTAAPKGAAASQPAYR